MYHHIAITNEEKEQLIYYIAQVDNDVYKALKKIREQEKEQSVIKSVVNQVDNRYEKMDDFNADDFF